MSQAPTVAGYLEKAERAVSGARLLLAANDTEGACNRAYFAMFDAAHAALLAKSPDVPEASTKTHHGLISAFGKYLVLGKHVEPALGSALNKVQRLRQVADYTGDPVSHEDAIWAVEQAEAFVDAMRAKFLPPKGEV
ncbi:MAG: HEPN domain-containing protein [Beijerinckiaceae bacterium]